MIVEIFDIVLLIRKSGCQISMNNLSLSLSTITSRAACANNPLVGEQTEFNKCYEMLCCWRDHVCVFRSAAMIDEGPYSSRIVVGDEEVYYAQGLSLAEIVVSTTVHCNCGVGASGLNPWQVTSLA